VSRLPIVVVALLVAMALVVAGLKWRLRRVVGAGPALASSSTASPPNPSGNHGLGAGQPAAAVEPPRGAPMLHGDARHTHRAAGRIPASRPQIVWSHNVGGPVEAQVTTSADEQTLYVASLAGAVTALARADGAERWTLALGDRAYATPCVGRDGTIYAGSDAKKLVALTPEGKLKWSLETEGEADTGPVLANDGTIVFAAGRMVYAVTPLGQVKWRFAAKRKVFTSPAIDPSGRVFFGSQDHRAYALTQQGGLSWSIDLGADVDGAPVIADDGAIFVGTDADEVVRLDPDGRGVLWRIKLGGYVRGTLSVARDGSVLAGVYGPTPREVRLRHDDGTVMGHFAIQGTGAREFGVHGGALEDDFGTLLFGTQDDNLYAVASSGDLLWQFTTSGDVDAPATLLGDGSVVIGSDDGSVYLLRAM
jgi:outer membrane protein assembly factor BamB